MSANQTLHFLVNSLSPPTRPMDNGTTQCVDVFIIVDDSIIEDDENFFLQLHIEDPIQSLYASISDSPTPVTILDNDGKIIIIFWLPKFDFPGVVGNAMFT